MSTLREIQSAIVTVRRTFASLDERLQGAKPIAASSTPSENASDSPPSTSIPDAPTKSASPPPCTETSTSPTASSDTAANRIERRREKDRARSRSPRAIHKKTLQVLRLPMRELYLEQARNPYPADVERPKTRGDCVNGERPCPFISRKHHLYLDAGAYGQRRNIVLNFPDVSPEDLGDLPETCSLDVADRGGSSLEQVGACLNMTRERVRQIEVKILAKLLPHTEPLRGDGPRGEKGKRRLPVVSAGRKAA